MNEQKGFRTEKNNEMDRSENKIKWSFYKTKDLKSFERTLNNDCFVTERKLFAKEIKNYCFFTERTIFWNTHLKSDTFILNKRFY